MRYLLILFLLIGCNESEDSFFKTRELKVKPGDCIAKIQDIAPSWKTPFVALYQVLKTELIVDNNDDTVRMALLKILRYDTRPRVKGHTVTQEMWNFIYQKTPCPKERE